MKRASGILLPIASLPSRYGIGTFSRCAYDFVDFLERAGQRYWQILPLGPTGYGDSPYQSFSTFAGNPYFIDLDQLAEEGLLSEEECEAIDAQEDGQYIDYQKLYETRFDILRKAYERSSLAEKPEYQDFLEENKEWLEDYCLFMAVKDWFGGKSFAEWDEDIRLRRPEAVERFRELLAEEIDFYRFQQFYFQKQWYRLKKYANSHGVEIIGDIPIYVAFDSADTWSEPALFQFDENGTPSAISGCPPDGFSATGQVWGNPLYDWEYHEKTGYAWWIKRMRRCFRLYDIVRVDHFRGFDEYFSIPYGQDTAQGGHWAKGPGIALFHALQKELGETRIIAEDLGFLTDSVIRFVRDTGYPGMKVLEFAFDSREESNYLPHTYTQNCVAYTGTHDNQTVVGWFRSLPEEDYRMAVRYLDLKREDENEINWKMIRTVLASVADTAIIPIQDYLGLDDAARINTPSKLGGNWIWRMKKNALTEEMEKKIRELTELYGRC
ncbi:4-alpha-glucanotransferase [Marvinbryantia sp.]|uniref:4-alpha-glucanotransferase n=1 Tax=Marvinbryantia sp. TaxID=2496532 RepID=UPI0025E5C4D1|nr:4-alpha-glucanotransferase [uncultured Marvinbryantia sp.]